MSNDSIIEQWKLLDMNVNYYSTEDLKAILIRKSKKVMNRFVYISLVSVTISTGVILFLTYTSLHRLNDKIYLSNNIVLGILTAIALVSGILALFYLKRKNNHAPLKQWLSGKISGLSVGVRNRLYLYFIPVYMVLFEISTHVYYENKPFLDAFKSEESVIGLLFGLPIGLLAALFVARKLRKYQLNSLDYLRKLYDELGE